MDLSIFFAGTAGSVPTARRGLPATLLRRGSDKILVDCGDSRVAVGDEVVLVGEQGDHTIDAWELAGHADTVAWEIVTRIGERVPRNYVGGTA